MCAFEALGEVGDVRWSALAIDALADPEDIVVVSAIECLVEWEARTSLAKIVRLLDGSSELTRAYAAWSIGKLGTRRHVPILQRRLRRLATSAEASAVAEALYMLTSEPRYLNRLLRQLRSRDPLARAFTTNSLVGVLNESNFARIAGELAQALMMEKSEWVLSSIRRDLTEIIALAVAWKSPAKLG